MKQNSQKNDYLNYERTILISVVKNPPSISESPIPRKAPCSWNTCSKMEGYCDFKWRQNI